MNSSNQKPRRLRSPALNPELLEKREMMTGGVGDTFAILPATIKKAGGQTSVSFTLDPKLFTTNGKKPFVIGIDVAPELVGIDQPDRQVGDRAQRQELAGPARHVRPQGVANRGPER